MWFSFSDGLHFQCYIFRNLDEEEQQGKLQDNVIQSENKIHIKERQLWGQGKQLLQFMCDIPYLL